MKQYLLKIAGLAALVLFFTAPGFAQQESVRVERDTLSNRSVGNQEVVLLFRNKKRFKSDGRDEGWKGPGQRQTRDRF